MRHRRPEPDPFKIEAILQRMAEYLELPFDRLEKWHELEKELRCEIFPDMTPPSSRSMEGSS